jgi:hypothetical protein
MRIEYPRQFGQHGRITRIIRLWGIGRREQPPFERWIIEVLVIVKIANLKSRGREKCFNLLCSALGAHILIVSAVLNQQLLVGAEKGRRSSAPLVPQQHSPTAGPADAVEFTSRLLPIKPVSRLGGGDQVDAVIGESRGFRRSRHAGELRISAQKFLPGMAHVGIRLHAVHAIAVLQQHAGEDASAGSNIGDVRPQSFFSRSRTAEG